MGTHDVMLFIFALMLLASTQKMCFAVRDTINSTHVLKDNGDTIVSSDGTFELGFFSPNNSSNRYVGIWYKQIPIRKVLWVANRDIPIPNTSSAVLQIINNPGSMLALVDANNGTLFWYTNSTTLVQNPVGKIEGKLLDSGNLVIIDANDDNPENFLWQSFEHPTNTLMPGMILGNNFLTGQESSLSAWKAENDPRVGECTFSLDPTGYPQLFLRNGGKEVHRLGPWNGISWSGTLVQENGGFANQTNFVINTTGVFYSFTLRNISTLGRLVIVLLNTGYLQSYSWADGGDEWNLLHTAPADVCDRYGYCGAYAVCDTSQFPTCECLDGDKFLPKDPIEWGRSEYLKGCVRRTPLSCENGSLPDGFLKYSDIKMPDSKFSWFDSTMNLEECKQVCLKNCSCTAYSTLDGSNGEHGCLIWFGDLIDIRVIPLEGQDLFIRLASSDLDYATSSKGKKLKKIRLGLSLLIVLLILSLAVIMVYYKRKRKDMESNLELDQDQMLFEASTITRVTDNFSLSNKIGEGGYGPVFQGVLDDGKEIAVKRLSKTSTQGIEEFKNEVNFIAKLQHRNLVKLLGWCIRGKEKMLIYEYMPNKSLDSFIFDNTSRTLLDWAVSFNIINGIARGILYLHQDSRLRIIHRDLKASNILLDVDMNPKISDFGLARSVGGNEIGANTNRVAGTHGYMSPEYAVHGIFSTKSDVFSFGVLVLEIVSRKRNSEFVHQDHYENLPSYAWKHYRDGKSIELVDDHLVESCNLAQVLRSIHVGLLCVQQRPEDRPSICSVVQMLSNDGDLPIAKEPGFFTGEMWNNSQQD